MSFVKVKFVVLNYTIYVIELVRQQRLKKDFNTNLNWRSCSVSFNHAFLLSAKILFFYGKIFTVMNMEKVLHRLRELREDNDLRQEDIANLLKTTQQVYSRYEKGINEIPIRHLITIARFYNVSIDYIVGVDCVDLSRFSTCNVRNALYCKSIIVLKNDESLLACAYCL